MRKLALMVFLCNLTGLVDASSGAGKPLTWRGESVLGRSSLETSLAPCRDEWQRIWRVALQQPFGTPFFYDVNGDGAMEVIAGDEVRAYVFDNQGNPLPGWPQSVDSIDNCGAAGDIDGDGEVEIVFGIRMGRVIAYRLDGSIQPGFPVNLPWQRWINVSSPVLADLDNDGNLDIGIASELGVSFVDGHGAFLQGWPYTWSTTQNFAWSAPAVADLDNDGKLEVAVGNNNFGQESFHVIHCDGTSMPGWPKSTGPIFSSCAVGDLDGDGDLEIVVQEGDPDWYGNVMHVWHHDGSYMTGWPQEIAPQWESSRSNPVIADVDNDGSPEIVSVTGDGNLHIFYPDGSEYPGYPKPTGASAPIASPQLIDIDGDGRDEIFLVYYADGNQYICGWHLDGSALPGFPSPLMLSVSLNAHGSASIADMDNDGDLDLAVCSTDWSSGWLWVFQIPGSVYQPELTRADWPKIRHDANNTGHYIPVGIVPTMTPQPSFTPLPTDTAQPSATITPQPSESPTGTATAAPSESPTIAATFTPTAAGSPTAAPTNTPLFDLEVRLEMPAWIRTGELFFVNGYLDNPGAPLEDVPVFFILDVYGDYWFWDDWTHLGPSDDGAIDYRIMDIAHGVLPVIVVPSFEWPDLGNSSIGGLRFWGAMLDISLTEVRGHLSMQEWGYGP